MRIRGFLLEAALIAALAYPALAQQQYDSSGAAKVNCTTGCAGSAGPGANNADGVAAVATGLNLAQNYSFLWNGATFDRWYGDKTNGAFVNVKTSVLPTGAALDATLAAIGAKFGSLGQKTMAGSAPVTFASDQSALPVTGTFWQATQPISAVSLPLPAGAAADSSVGTTNTDIGPPGATACATDTGSCSLNALLQRLAQRLTTAIGGTAVTLADGASATLGTTTGAAVTTDATGTVQQYLRGLIKQWTAGTLALGAGSNVVGKVGIDQTTPGTTNAVDAGSFTDRVVSTPTVQNASYVSGNCVGGFNSVTFQGTGPINLLNDVRLYSQGGGTETITVYVFDSNPTASTCTDKSTFTLNSADVSKTMMGPFALTLVAPTGTTVSFAGNPNIARIPKSGTTTLYYALVAGSTFTPATTTDLLVGFQVAQQHQ